MRTSKNTERSLRLATTAAVRQKNIADYFLKYSQAVRPWLKELAERYKEKGEFPLIPMSVLPSYYDDIRDKEIAAYVALLIPETENVLKNIGEFRQMLGESPWEWFKSRGFVRLGIGKVQDKRTGGVFNWKIANLLNRLWEHIEKSPHSILLNRIKPKFKYLAVESLIEWASKENYCSHFDVLTYMLEDCCVGNYFYKVRLFLQVLACSDGFSLDLWSVDPSELKCPLVKGFRQFLQTWFPDYRRYGSMDDAIHLFGFERDCDFLYAYLAYKELQTRSPKVCSMFSTTYLRWYDMGVRKKPYQFRRLLPEIENQKKG